MTQGDGVMRESVSPIHVLRSLVQKGADVAQMGVNEIHALKSLVMHLRSVETVNASIVVV